MSVMRKSAFNLAVAFTLALTVGPDIAASAQTSKTPLLLVVSQPGEGVKKEQFVDLTPHLEPALKDSGKFLLVSPKSTDKNIEAAVKEGKISPSEYAAPLSHERARRLASAIGAPYILYVSASSGKDGLSVQAEAEVQRSQNSWNVAFADNIAPLKGATTRTSILEGIHFHVDRLVTRLTGAPPAVPTAQANVIPIDPPAVEKGNNKAMPNANSNKAAAGTEPSAAVGPKPKPNTVSIYDLQIERARRNNDLANLIVALRRAVTEKPRNSALRRDLAQAYRDRGMAEAARDEISTALSLTPGDAEMHKLAGDIHRAANDVQMALKEYQEAVRLDDKDPRFRIALGDLLVSEGLTDEAIVQYNAAAKSTPKVAVAFLRLGKLGLQQGKTKESIEALKAAHDGASPEEIQVFAYDISAILTVVESSLGENIGRLQAAKASFNNSTKSREETFKDVAAVKKRLDSLANYLDELPEFGFGRIVALYSQAAALAVQSSDKLLEFLETQTSAIGDEANLLRLEANRQLSDASKKLKAFMEAKTAKQGQ